jgi:hypothetical protein
VSPLAQAHPRRVYLISVTGRRVQVGPIQAGAQLHAAPFRVPDIEPLDVRSRSSTRRRSPTSTSDALTG